MRGSLPEVRALTRRLLESHTAGPEPIPRAEAAEFILRRFAERISPLLGGEGFRMLLGRALKRAEREYDLLRGVHAARESERTLSGLDAAAQTHGREELGAALEAVLTELIGLIARFLGADMAIRLVRQSCPEIEAGSPPSGLEATNHE